MYPKLFLNLFILIVIAAMQISFVSILPGFLSDINIIVIVIVFLLGLNYYEQALWWAVGAGLIFDFFSFYPFGAYLVSIPLAIVITHFLLVNFLTNRSLYSFLAMYFFAYFFYKVFSSLFIFLIFFFEKKDFPGILNSDFFRGEITSLAVNLFLVIVIFYSLNLVTEKLKTSFLFK